MIKFKKVFSVNMLIIVVTVLLTTTTAIYSDVTPSYNAVLVKTNLRVPIGQKETYRRLGNNYYYYNGGSLEALWKNPEISSIKQRFTRDLEQLVKTEKAAVIFFASDTDGSISASLIIKKIKEIALTTGRETQVLYSLGNYPEEKDGGNILYIYAIGYQDQHSFSDYYRTNLGSLIAHYGKIPFYMLDINWDSATDFRFLMRNFKFWNIDHHMQIPKVQEEIDAYADNLLDKKNIV